MWIEPHTNPNILKLGIKWALYREKKPDKNNYFNKFSISIWEEESRIAYLKEPELTQKQYDEFKYKFYVVKDFSYKNTYLNIKGDVIDHKLWDYSIFVDLLKKGFLSHYYPGQQVESFKYVRKVEHLQSAIDYQEGFSEWQEVEEPEEEKINLHSLIVKGTENKYPNPKYTQFQADIKQAKILAEIN